MAPQTVRCHEINRGLCNIESTHQVKVHSQSHNQWQIQDCPDGEMPTTEFGPETYYLARLAENCMKMKEIGQGGKSPSASLHPSISSTTYFFNTMVFQEKLAKYRGFSRGLDVQPFAFNGVLDWPLISILMRAL